MAVTPGAPDDPHTHPNDATQVFPRQEPSSYAGRPPHDPRPNDVAGLAGGASAHDPRPLDATMVMPRRERPAWRGPEPAEAAQKARRLRNRKIASMVFAATGLLVVTSGAWAVLGSGPGDPTFAGAVPTLPAAHMSASAGPAAVAPLQPVGEPTSGVARSETVTPSAARTSGTPRTKRRTHVSGAPSASVRASARAAGRKSDESGITPSDARPLSVLAPASVSIESPQDGETVEETVTVSGEAEVPDGHQVYLLTGSDQETSTCQGESHFVCGPVAIDDGEETVPLAVVVAPEGDAAAATARDQITVQRTAD
ncbi:hypothetical protein ACTI_56940 [Actinoplanes sp. OR16]|uniref:hypothetical protein n=1 Tax=Actinoplanes sp. OR16 TaxID=946334 RepID=UPI000F6F417A|nr:hypothetical protein [Actinoplanes sp. OR16]BBH69009.1 hypothetical protein ACTI_56940 [Actinoplanes sp. OR16]